MRFYNGAPVYEVGTKVRVRKIDRPDYHSVVFVEPMENFRGQELTISCVCLDVGKAYPFYAVHENGWYWDDSMLDCIAELDDEVDDELESASFGGFFDKFGIK